MIEQSWNSWLKQEFAKPYFQNMRQFLNQEFKDKTCFPPKNLIFRAFSLTPPSQVKVVILGQDPYHQPNQADGLAFSVMPGQKLPMSLFNILTELQNDCGFAVGENGDLTAWAKQGVLLLNTILTVQKGKPLSHQSIGWELFTNHVIKYLNCLEQPIVYVLWGKKAQMKQQLLNNSNHHIVSSSHPSPYSVHYGFFGSRAFSRVNAFLVAKKLTPVSWRLF